MSNKNSPLATDSNYLPDFCAPGPLFIAVLVGQLLAIVLSLATFQALQFWYDLSMYSLFIQSTAICSAAALCLFKPLFKRLQTTSITLLALSSILLITGLLSIGKQVFVDDLPSQQVTLVPVLINLVISLIVSTVVLRYLYIQSQWRHRLQTESQARIQALQSRIRPHFLFNSMNTIASLTRTDARMAEQVVEDLAELFRTSLSDAASLSTLNDEITLSEHYLSIESLRLGDRLTVDWQLDQDIGHVRLPSLTLQPLLENAVYHGIEPSAEGGRITISTGRHDQMIEIRVRNTLPGENDNGSRPGNQLAIDNIRERLAIHYDGRARLQIQADASHYEVLLSLPQEGVR